MNHRPGPEERNQEREHGTDFTGMQLDPAQHASRRLLIDGISSPMSLTMTSINDIGVSDIRVSDIDDITEVIIMVTVMRNIPFGEPHPDLRDLHAPPARRRPGR